MTGWPGWRPGWLAGRLDKLEMRNLNSNQWGFALCFSRFSSAGDAGLVRRRSLLLFLPRFSRRGVTHGLVVGTRSCIYVSLCLRLLFRGPWPPLTDREMHR